MNDFVAILSTCYSSKTHRMTHLMYYLSSNESIKGHKCTNIKEIIHIYKRHQGLATIKVKVL